MACKFSDIISRIFCIFLFASLFSCSKPKKFSFENNNLPVSFSESVCRILLVLSNNNLLFNPIFLTFSFISCCISFASLNRDFVLDLSVIEGGKVKGAKKSFTKIWVTDIKKGVKLP